MPPLKASTKAKAKKVFVKSKVKPRARHSLKAEFISLRVSGKLDFFSVALSGLLSVIKRVCRAQ